MNKFLVMIEGKNCLMHRPSKKCGFSIFLPKKKPRKFGFFATRFATANAASEAGETVIRLVELELKSQWKIENIFSDPPVFLVSEIRDASSMKESDVAVKGFTFYAEAL